MSPLVTGDLPRILAAENALLAGAIGAPRFPGYPQNAAGGKPIAMPRKLARPRQLCSRFDARLDHVVLHEEATGAPGIEGVGDAV